MKIRKIHVHHANRSIWGHLAEREKTLPLVTPLDIYTDFKETRGSWFWDSGMAVIQIETDDGLIGTGWCEDGCSAVRPIVENHLCRLLIDQDPLEIESLWDRLFRATLPYGRKGTVLQVISAIDIALWDLLGQATQQPVGRLLGGRFRDRVKPYVSLLIEEPAKLREKLLQFKENGFRAFKIGWGQFGRKNRQVDEVIVSTAREAIGPHDWLMVDAGGSDAFWTQGYKWAVQTARMLVEYDVYWFEEPLKPDALRDYILLRQTAPLPIAGGEVLTRRQSFLPWLAEGAFDIV